MQEAKKDRKSHSNRIDCEPQHEPDAYKDVKSM